jgi:putative transposase
LLAEEVIKEESVSVGRACRIIGLPRSMFYYKSIKDDSEVEKKLLGFAENKSTRGFEHYYGLIRNEGLVWNHKRVKRIYNKLGLNLRRKKRKRVPARIKEPLIKPINMNLTWSMDFMHDAISSGRKVKVLNIIDDYNREALAIDIASSITGYRVVEVLKMIIDWRGKPEEIRCDNGPEFISAALVQFCEGEKIRIKYTQPGKPVQNAFIERFNRTFREDVLNAYIFDTISELRMIAEEWMTEYNEKHPHQSLGGMSPKQYLAVNCRKHLAHAAPVLPQLTA